VVASAGNEIPISISPGTQASKPTQTTETSPRKVTENAANQDISPADNPSPAPTGIQTAGIQNEQTEPGETISTSVSADGPDRTKTQSAHGSDQSDATGTAKLAGEIPKADNDAVKSQATALSGSGPWIINLLSSRKKLDTDRLAEVAVAHDIPVVQSRAIVKGKEYWRLQVTGFRNATEAKNYAIPVKKTLGIKDVWIFKQKEG
jgi:hypothetical protein